MFTAAIEAPGRKTIQQRLQVYYELRYRSERGEIRQQLAASLNHLSEAGHNVVDLYSFVTINFRKGIFEYFKMQVRTVPTNLPNGTRKKDREDQVRNVCNFVCCVVVSAYLHALCVCAIRRRHTTSAALY